MSEWQWICARCGTTMLAEREQCTECTERRPAHLARAEALEEAARAIEADCARYGDEKCHCWSAAKIIRALIPANRDAT